MSIIRRPSVLSGLIPVGLVLLVSTSTGHAQEDLSSLAAALRPVILESLPKPLHESSHNWGRTSMTPNQLKWRGLKPQIIKAPKNDGTWRKLRATARDPNQSLVFTLGDLRSAGDDKLTFKAFFALGVDVDYEHQLWESGVRLYSGSLEARLRIKANLDCETVLRLEPNPKSILPDTIFRMRVAKADISYDNLVVERIAGIGGSGAKLIGEALHSTIREIRPSLERDLLARANAAVVKAGDTREVRLSVSKLLGKIASP